ncbi:hypothetical protein DICA2_E02828 [Diutina catenulata]
MSFGDTATAQRPRGLDDSPQRSTTIESRPHKPRAYTSPSIPVSNGTFSNDVDPKDTTATPKKKATAASVVDSVEEYPMVALLEVETLNAIAENPHPNVTQLLGAITKYLREPRYASPLTITELSDLFQILYRDLYSVVIGTYTQSNSLKKSLIAHSDYFNNHPKIFDYLLAIANYSASSIKLLKRHDADALYQLRVFNFYKFLRVFFTIEYAQKALFASVTSTQTSSSASSLRGVPINDKKSEPETKSNSEVKLERITSGATDGVTLYDKLFRFEQKDVIHQEFFDEKLALLRQLDLPWSAFIHSDSSSINAKIDYLFGSVTPEQLEPLNAELARLNSETTPYRKLVAIATLNKALIKLLATYEIKGSEVNNDVLLPTLIYLVVAKLDWGHDLFLNFEFCKKFAGFVDPSRVELYQVQGLNSALTSYQPQERIPKTMLHKHRYHNLFELLNMNLDMEQGSNDKESTHKSEFDFFSTTRQLVGFIQDHYLNHGELSYYMTNLEALVTFLSTVTLKELIPGQELNGSTIHSHNLMVFPIGKVVDEDLMSHFTFPEGTLVEEENARNSPPRTSPAARTSPTVRSRSSSLLNTISKLADSASASNRSRSNSSIMNSLRSKESAPSVRESHSKESFPTLEDTDTDTSSFSMMRTFLGRLNSVSVSQFSLQNDNGVSTSHANGPAIHSRTRSSSFDTQKRNSITNKFASGVSEFMTKFNNPVAEPSPDIVSDGDEDQVESSMSTIRGVAPSPGHSRTRTNSGFQIMDKWLNNLAVTSPVRPVHSAISSTTSFSGSLSTNNPLAEITRFQGADFDSLSIKDLKQLKSYYDLLCQERLHSFGAAKD